MYQEHGAIFRTSFLAFRIVQCEWGFLKYVARLYLISSVVSNSSAKPVCGIVFKVSRFFFSIPLCFLHLSSLWCNYVMFLIAFSPIALFDTRPKQNQSYGAHIDDYPVPYLTAAAAIGVCEVQMLHFRSSRPRATSPPLSIALTRRFISTAAKPLRLSPRPPLTLLPPAPMPPMLLPPRYNV